MGRKFFFNRFHNFLRIFMWAAASVAGLGSLVAIVLAIKLSAGPISLDFTAPYLDNYITSQNSPYTARVDSAELLWDKENGCLAIQAKDVSVQHNEAQHDSLHLPNFQFRFHLSSLLHFKLVPFEVAIVDPHIKLYRGANGQIYLNKNNEGHETGVDLLNNFLLAGLSNLRNVKVSGLHIDVLDLKTDETWDVPQLDLTFRRKGTNIQCDMKADSRGAKVEGQILIQLQKDAGRITNMDMELYGLLTDFNFDDLDKFWHPNLAPTPRTWIMENLSKSAVKKADLKASWHVDLTQEAPQLLLKELNGEIHFTGMQVAYWGNLPPVQGVDGIAKYNHKDFDIKILKGKLKDISITGGRVFITNMHLDDQKINIDLDMDGPLHTALAILDEKPLQLSTKLDLKPQNVTGHAKGKIHFNFPLESTVTPDRVNYTAKTVLKGVQVLKPLGETTDTNLTNGDLILNVDRNSMVVEGKGHYGDMPVNIKWQQRFDDHPKDWTVRYDISASLTPKQMQLVGFGGYTDGPVPMKAILTENGKYSGQLHTEFDFSQTQILLPLIQDLHKQGSKATLIIDADLNKRKLQKITNCHFAGKDFSMTPRIEFSAAQQAITAVDCPDLRLGKTRLDLKIKKENKLYNVNLRGKSLDLEKVINYLKTRESNDDPVTPFQFSCSIENAWFHEGKKRVYNLRAEGMHSADGLESCSVTGQLDGGDGGQIGELRLEQKKDGAQKELILTSNNAGETLDLMGLTAAVRGGELGLHMIKQSNAKWTGKLKVSDFNLMEAPAVTRILSFISPFGILEVVAGKPLAFVKFSTRMSLDDDRILFKQGRAVGPSIGLNVNGTINRKNNTLDLHGTILPYNAINVFLAKVPIVSQLLGGKGGGIFGFQYSIEGPIDEPDTFVNPLSALTPGILRNVFAHPDPEEGGDKEDSGQ